MDCIVVIVVDCGGLQWIVMIVKIDIHAIGKTNKSWNVVCVKVRQLFTKHGVSKIVLWIG